jgi:hypothetical protein
MAQHIGWEDWPVASTRCDVYSELVIRDWLYKQTISDKFYEIHTPSGTHIHNTYRPGAANNYVHTTSISFRIGDTKLLNYMILKWNVQVLPSHNEFKQATHRIDINTVNKYPYEYIDWDELMEEDHRRERGS